MRVHPNRSALRRLTLVSAFSLLLSTPIVLKPEVPVENEEIPSVIRLPQMKALPASAGQKPAAEVWHPPHTVKVWMARHKGRTFRVIQLPNCEHVETLISYEPRGQTLKQAKARLGGVAACTGSFHHPRTMALADFLQKQGAVLASARTDRPALAVLPDGGLHITQEHHLIKGQPGISAVNLGQSLIPLQRNGFSVAFMNRATDRMALGLNKNFIFIVQGKSDIWRLAHFMQHKLPCRVAVNTDGGHVVRGKGPVHIVFRWKKDGPTAGVAAESTLDLTRTGGT